MTDRAQSPQPNQPLGRVGRYELRATLASGGMASVFLGHLQGPHGFEKLVAVKRIHPHLKTDERFVAMFLDEARIAARIHHPNVCAILDFGDEQGTPYIVMEYLNGEPLSSVMRAAHRQGGAAPVWLAARVVHDAARGLHAAHELTAPDGTPLGVVHRDVSPQNVFVLYDGLTKVVDFGVARARGRISVTRTNEVKGKLPYMAPEQFEQEQADRRADIWALGVLLWEASVGRRLFRGENDAATLARVLQKPIPRPSELVPEYPPELEAIVMKCLERDITQRYQTAEGLADDLEELIYAIGKPAGAAQVKKWMHEQFGAAIEERAALLRGDVFAVAPAPQESSSLSSIRSRSPTQDNDDNQPTAIAGSSGGMRAPRVADAPARSQAKTPWLAILAILTSGLVIAGAILVIGRRDDPPPIAPTVTSPSASVAPPLAVEPAPSPPPPLEAAPGAVAVPTEIEEVEPAEEATTARPRTRRPSRRAPATPTSPAAMAPSPAPASASTAPGTLNLIAIPSAAVRIDGRDRGHTPVINLSLPPGEHRVELRTDDGRTRTLRVEIESGRATRQRVEL